MSDFDTGIAVAYLLGIVTTYLFVVCVAVYKEYFVKERM